MKIVLIHPPLDDPTLPYHSIAYLRGHLAHNGFHDVSARDLNVEFVNYCLEEDVIRQFYDEIDARQKRFASRGGLAFNEQEEFYQLWSAERVDPRLVREAAAVQRNYDAFIDFDAYHHSVVRLRRHFQMLGALCYPAEIHEFKYKSRGRYSIYHLNDLFNAELCSRVCYPIERFFHDRCAEDPDLSSGDCIGMSIVYDHQLLPALHLMRLIRNRWPEKLLLLGGTGMQPSL